MSDPDRDRGQTHYYGDDCDPPHVDPAAAVGPPFNCCRRCGLDIGKHIFHDEAPPDHGLSEGAFARPTTGYYCPPADGPPFNPPWPVDERNRLIGTHADPPFAIGRPFTSDDVRPCEHEGCPLPGRFAIGLDHGAMRYWCVDHIEDGMAYFGALVRGIREAIRRA